ncbi:cellulose synthase/poly-beta-1,6-N-acetylglucosamine synthase-like glycosyltransferase [Dyadobacter jejuensis]|uniref:Cellulose synthase/poly-beta-1,6-N-acetylglucosamine synthase-like glycosyltransferase n=1 Tax=Dyadobacter jejuensis TaxID=1082580 RepID=A0A316B2L5_9BACT|nr:glycosyltransferase family 2 protein [Dyadobacter jejuensis]PWJ56787.1 cellulose synthase/poly-beta-1,6-N-acetylglucosamine synthase-like glycosyltransferase [Dyadobacter jejuensis]
MEIFFWISLGLVFYTFLGYGMVLYLLLHLLRIFRKSGRSLSAPVELPTLTLVVAAYNEADIIAEKVRNTCSLQYPAEKLRVVFMTDGSTDGTPELISQMSQRDLLGIEVMHEDARRGKIHAIHRAMEAIESEVVVFTDANTFLNEEALLTLARHYADPSVGAVSGEKRVQAPDQADATAGEGLYWKYESTLKRWDSELFTVVGAAGELFSIRTALYQPVPSNAILDDFMISMQIAQKGYRIIYEPEAYAVEWGSENIHEELKRKIRIAAGGIQSIIWLKALLNPFKYPLLSFQYISHRVLRWTLTPLLLPVILLLNILIVAQPHAAPIYNLALLAQGVFYGLALLGWVMENRKVRLKALFVPYYFCMMNVAVLAGIYRFAKGKQSAIWEKSVRKS